jgi:hypothetical protein
MSSGPSLVGTLAGFRRDPLRALTETVAAHGDVARLSLRGRSIFLLRGPDAARHVLVANQDNYSKESHRLVLRRALGNGLFTAADRRTWATHRQLIQPHFSARRIADYAPATTASAADELDLWPTGPVDLYARTTELAIRAYAVRGRLRAAQTPRGPGRRGAQRAGGPAGDDGNLLDLLLRIRDDTGALTADDVRDEIFPFLFAGSESVAVTLSWMWHLPPADLPAVRCRPPGVRRRWSGNHAIGRAGGDDRPAVRGARSGPHRGRARGSTRDPATARRYAGDVDRPGTRLTSIMCTRRTSRASSRPAVSAAISDNPYRTEYRSATNNAAGLVSGPYCRHLASPQLERFRTGWTAGLQQGEESNDCLSDRDPHLTGIPPRGRVSAARSQLEKAPR